MKKNAVAAGMSAALLFGLTSFGLAGAANAADMPLPTKAWAAPASDACSGLTDFLLSSCRLSWYGVTFYGTVDMGGTYQTHGAPFDPNFPTGASYLLGGGGGNATGRTAGFRSRSQRHEPIERRRRRSKNLLLRAAGRSLPTASLRSTRIRCCWPTLRKHMQNAIGVPQNQQESPIDSSRWGWLNGESNMSALASRFLAR